MNTHHSRPRRTTLAQLLTALAAALVLAFGFAAGTAQSDDDDGERKFENGIPAHVPLKVKLKNERAFKDKGNKEWGRDLEVEVTNTSSKDLYYMFMIIEFPDYRLGDGNMVAILIKYGRAELWNLEEPILPEDVPVRPGESYTFKIPEENWRAFEAGRKNRNRESPKHVRFVMQFITYGDGTGFEGVWGNPTPRPRKKRSQVGSPYRQTAAACRPAPEARAFGSPAKFLRASFLPEPADLLRVDFSQPEPAADDCDCQNVPNCFYGVIIQRASHCPCDNQSDFPSHVSTGNCSDPSGRCRQVVMRHDPCDTVNGQRTCSYDESVAPCAVTDPTPAPSPAPSPTRPPPPNPTNCTWVEIVQNWHCFCLEGDPAVRAAMTSLTRALGGRIS